MKTLFITGASRGMGLVIAKKFLDLGYFVVATSQSGNTPLESENLKVFSLDYLKEETIEKLVSDFSKINKKIDVLVNNSGILLDKGELEIDIDKLRKTLEVNLIGPISLTEKLIPYMNKNSHIINISSMAAVLGGSLDESWIQPSYKISKAGVNMYTKTLGYRLEKLENKNITVYSLDPGWVKTEMGTMEAEREPEEVADDIEELVSKKRESGQFWFKGKKRSW